MLCLICSAAVKFKLIVFADEAENSAGDDELLPNGCVTSDDACSNSCSPSSSDTIQAILHLEDPQGGVVSVVQPMATHLVPPVEPVVTR